MNKAKYLLALPYALIRTSRRMLRIWKLIELRLRGVNVAWSANVHITAVFELSGGEITIGERSFIDRGVILRAYGGFINIHSDCSVNAYTIITGKGGVNIGDAVRIAPRVNIIASNHVFEDLNMCIMKQGETAEGITIDSDVWIGAGVTILDGVRIAQGTVIGAGAVVAHSTEAHSVNVGVPARIISRRK